MRWVATLLVAMLALLAVRAERNHLQAWRLRERAETSYYGGDFKTTLARYDAVIDRRPGEPRSYTDPADTISQYLSGAGQELPLDEFETLTRQAVRYYLGGLDASPPSAWTFGRIATLAESLRLRRARDGETDLARLSGNLDALTPEDRLSEAAWVKAVKIEPRNFYYRDYIGDYYLRRGFRRRALEHFRYAVRLHPVLEKHFYLSGFAESSPDVLLAVEEGVQDALAAEDTDVPPYNIHRFLAQLYLKLGRIDDARRAFEAASKVAPYPHIVEVQIGELLARQGDDAGALAAFRRSTETAPDYYRGWLLLGLTLSRRGEHEEAIAAGYRARGLNPTDFVVSMSLARILHAGGMPGEAAEILEHLVRDEPGRQQAYTQLIRQYEDSGRLVEAARVARTLAERFPDEPAYRRQLEQLERSRSTP